MKTYSPILLAVLLACLSVLIYLNTLGHQFVNFDDTSLIVQNPYIKSLSFENITAIFTPGVVGVYQPVRTLSYALDYHFWQLNPTGYHLTNILCHTLNTLLVFLIAYLLSKHLLLASLTALIFAVHPIHAEAVAWVAGRCDVLASALALASCSCFLWIFPIKTQSRRWIQGTVYGLALILFAAGLLTKPSVVILPLLLVVYDLCFVDPLIFRQWRRSWLYVPFFFTAILITWIFMAVARASGVVETQFHAANAFTRGLTMLRVLKEYVLMLFIPRLLSVTYDVQVNTSLLESEMLIALAVLGIVAILTFLTWKHSKIAFFGIAWFFVSLLPVANIIPIAIIKADRYLYLPSVGFCLAFAWLIVWAEQLLTRAVKTRFVSIGYWAVISLVLISFSFQTIQRNRDWKDSHTLWTATLETHPDSSIALNNLGLIYAKQGQYEKALALYEQLISLHPEQEHIERVYVNIADAYAAQQMFEEAIENYQSALETNPEYVEAYLGLAGMSIELQQYAHAEQIYAQALELGGQQDRIYTSLGNLYALQNKHTEALKYFQKALDLNPFDMNAYNGMGMSYARSGDVEKALELYQHALTLDPDAAIIHNSLGTLYLELGQPDKASTAFTTSLSIEPENAEVRNNLGIVYLQTGRYEDAARAFMSALTYQPNHAKMLSNLGIAYTHLGLYEQAIQMFQWALENDAALFQTHVLLGDVCLGTGQIACAREAYQNALQLQPNNQDVMDKLEAVRQRETEVIP
ncbi:conserved hypothetical TPR repeat protein [Candidatus Vecturithrix granuli]|uniref:Conserved hypothetical TPR repeat protein n=1 Tax=Vecturithrix granuli TaxID=1499967 RepID=A0A081BZ87_VECG1|nr:conserved hypothetical TPR repeat protein [Candidatus Vecturithrix granuli]